MGRSRLRHRRQELGQLAHQEPARRRQHPLPVRPRGQQPGHRRAQGHAGGPRPRGKYKFIGQQPFEVTNWDPAKTQQVLSAAIAKYPKIDAIVSDFGPSLVGALPEFEKSGRSIPALATSDGNVLSCFYEDNKAKNPDFKLTTVATGNDNARLAVQWAVALATGGTPPSSKQFQAPLFEDSVQLQAEPGHAARRTSRRHLPLRPDDRAPTRPTLLK